MDTEYQSSIQVPESVISVIWYNEHPKSVCVSENDPVPNFEWDHTVVRRGGIFSFSIKNGKSANKRNKINSKIKIHLKANGQCLHDSQISYSQREEVSKSQWNLKSSTEPGKNGVYHLETPCDCEIGEYEITIKSEEKILGKEKFLMLCNPWNSNDETYMLDEEDRKEYILNTETIVYKGYSFSISGDDWRLDQFSKETIETLLFLLTKIDRPARSNAYQLTRELTALVNHLDDNGVVVGKWKPNFSGGKSPDYWSGSKEILRKYMKNKNPVKFGQCFTFAAILCSLFRLTGIGCRIVTCFDCLYDADDTLDMEMYYDNECNYLPHLSNDSIWIFHCWNECYMKCPDIDKYNGWHVLDATPQAKSNDGRYTCGPAPVAAIKSGDLQIGYDTRFIFSEVNGDVINKKLVNDEFETFDVEIARIGKNISTKAVGSRNRNDITNDYKYIDGFLLDVMARKNADSSPNRILLSESIIDVHSVMEKDHILMGEDLDISINLHHVSDTADVNDVYDIVMKCFVIQHPNIRSGEISNKRIELENKTDNTTSFRVASKDILEKVESDLCSVLVEVFAVDGEKFYKRNFYLPIKTPSFDFVLPPKTPVNKICEVCVKLANPLPTDLENVCVKLQIDFSDEKHKIHIGKITTGSPIEAKFNVTPNKKGFYEVKAIIYGDNIPTFKEIKSINIV